MANQFKVGDVVYLKSDDSVALSVYEVRDDGTVYCSWMNEKKELQRQPFQQEQLQKNEE